MDLGDKRREARTVLLAERLADRPTASLPGACGGWAETQGAYRLFRQESFDWMDLLEPHRACTTQRMASHPVVLCLQDTTELDYNGQQIKGLGPLSYEAQRGLYLHPTLAVSPEREPLGVLDAWMWAREPKDEDGTRPGEKESRRWVEGYERVAELAEQLPQTRLVYVGDRESDMLELMVQAHDGGYRADYLLRAQHNRALPDGGKLWAEVRASEVLGELNFILPPTKTRKARSVRQQLRAKRVTLSDRRGGTLQVTCLIASEINPPKGETPIEWRLLTNREVKDVDAASELVDWYRARWEIELFFLVLKQGCRVEALQLSTVERLEKALVLFMIVAWRVARLMRLGRTAPELDAALLFSPEEWQAAYILAKKRPPKQAPTLNTVIRLIAGHGGFLGRKCDGEPGMKTLWLGLQRVRDFAEGLQFAQSLQGT
ncbi:MAG: IS4 family transposase [Lamprobacter sp.]|uniref:IS4 family transposase n=1 Tax=Lamprobacter sp. TaxID=3100796 RepID=UPI002B25FF4C|nr:IS4 family transposase [Lamprobacter sp.]MEA3644014.1 IS4 family transposase [Lamprobacter sp.]